MNVRDLHSWDVSAKEAIKIQRRLKKRIIFKNSLTKIKTIASCDVSFSKSDNSACACVMVFSYPALEILEKVLVKRKIKFPYIPGLLTFREGPILLSAFKKLKFNPDLIVFDGQGICHPRRMGIAAHLGVILDKPTIGCAKSYLCGSFRPPGKLRGLRSFIKDERNNQILGAAVCTKDSTKPVFISVGNKISLNRAIKIILSLSRYRVPEPIRLAHYFCKTNVKV